MLTFAGRAEDDAGLRRNPRQSCLRDLDFEMQGRAVKDREQRGAGRDLLSLGAGCVDDDPGDGRLQLYRGEALGEVSRERAQSLLHPDTERRRS